MDQSIHKYILPRLQGYDYSQAGAYFVTICTEGRKQFFGKMVNGEIKLNNMGNIVTQAWHELPNKFSSIRLDEFIIMPNHIHGILWIRPIGDRGPINAINAIVAAQFIVPVSSSLNGNPMSVTACMDMPLITGMMNHAATLGNIIRNFKATSTCLIRKSTHQSFAWQRNYHDRIIRHDAELNRIRQYIIDNPRCWTNDPENDTSRLSNH